MPEKATVKLAGHLFTRNHPFPNVAGRQIFGRERVRLLQIPGDRLRILGQGKPSGLKIAPPSQHSRMKYLK